MLHITLGERQKVDASDPLVGRIHNGWREGMSEHEMYVNNRGRWVLGERADRERYALFSAKGVVRMAVEIDRLRSSDGTEERDPDGRRCIEGKVLPQGHPVREEYVGKPTPVTGQRNPVAYFDSPLDGRMCGCGCGEAVPMSRDFLSGHDQRAIHDRISKVGSVTAFLSWFDRTWESA